MSSKNTNDTTNNNEDNDEEYRDREDKWEGFHFTRLTCISILTLIIMIVALILDNLSVWGKERKCTFQECATGDCSCGSQSGPNNAYENYPECIANGECGWRTGSTKWVKPNGFPICPGCSDSTYCIDGSQSTNDDGTITNWESEFNFRDLCQNHLVNGEKDDDACMAVDGGNVYLVFTIFAIIFNLFTLCIIAPCMLFYVFHYSHNRIQIRIFA